MNKYEIEIKSLLGSKENVDTLRARLKEKDPKLKLIGQGKQRNHYFNIPADVRILEEVVAPLYSSKEKRREVGKILKNVKGNVSVRTREVDLHAPSKKARQADGKVSFILKASIGDDSSANGVSRIEFEEAVKLTLEELDQKLLEAGLTYQAKWSREREEYASGKTHITIDKNAGYGYLAEFEQVLTDREGAEKASRKLLALMHELGVSELPQERLERMFAHYNKHWEEYYGTDKTFTIE